MCILLLSSNRDLGGLSQLTHRVLIASRLFRIASVPLLRKDADLPSQSLLVSCRVHDKRAVIDGLACQLLVKNGVIVDQTLHGYHPMRGSCLILPLSASLFVFSF